MGVVFFAVFLPVIMIPLLSSVVQPATMIVSSAVQSAAMVTGMAASSSVAAAGDARKASAGGWGIMKAAAMGAGSGFMGGMSNVGGQNMNLGPGSINLNTSEIGRGISQGTEIGHEQNPEFAKYDSVGKQTEAIDKKFDEITNEGNTKEAQNKLSNEFHNEDLIQKKGESVEEYNKRKNEIISDETDRRSGDGSEDTLSDGEREAVKQSNGRFGEENERISKGMATDEDFEHIRKTMREELDKGGSLVTEERLDDKIKELVNLNNQKKVSDD